MEIWNSLKEVDCLRGQVYFIALHKFINLLAFAFIKKLFFKLRNVWCNLLRTIETAAQFPQKQKSQLLICYRFDSFSLLIQISLANDLFDFVAVCVSWNLSTLKEY